jgi:hypothetical protein
LEVIAAAWAAVGAVVWDPVGAAGWAVVGDAVGLEIAAAVWDELSGAVCATVGAVDAAVWAGLDEVGSDSSVGQIPQLHFRLR